MIELKKQFIDKESGNIVVVISLPHPNKGVYRYSSEQVEKKLDTMGVKRGKCLTPTQVCNKPGNPLEYQISYKPVVAKKVSQKSEEKLDKSSESVKITKTTTRRKKTGG
tara:strand:+ start:2181 stop:2507 length:327 start_codon:yes stop_codon:yes gene_type:complete